MNSPLIRFNFYIARELLDRVKATAAKEHRSVSSTIVVALEEYISKHNSQE